LQLGFFGGAVSRVASQNPPTEPDDAQRRDQKSDAQPKPGRNPLADVQKDHVSNYRQNRHQEYFGKLARLALLR
jgi:hypothetical protein